MICVCLDSFGTFIVWNPNDAYLWDKWGSDIPLDGGLGSGPDDWTLQYLSSGSRVLQVRNNSLYLCGRKLQKEVSPRQFGEWAWPIAWMWLNVACECSTLLLQLEYPNERLVRRRHRAENNHPEFESIDTIFWNSHADTCVMPVDRKLTRVCEALQEGVLNEIYN